MSMNMLTAYLYIGMKYRIFLFLKRQQSILFEDIFLMQEKSFSSKIYTQDGDSIAVSQFRDRDKESITTENDISTFLYGFLKFLNNCRCKKCLYVSNISRTSIIEKCKMIPVLSRCSWREELHILEIYRYSKYWRHRHLVSILIVTSEIDIHNLTCST